MSEAGFKWTDKFLLGYGPMDNVHHEFVELVNALLTCPDAELATSIEAFAKHAEHHFEEELKWMKATEFPSTNCHADEHAAVMKSLNDVRPLVAAGRYDIARSFAAALVDWFPGHADYMDSALAHWMIKKRYGGAPIVLRRGVKPAESADEAEVSNTRG